MNLSKIPRLNLLFMPDARFVYNAHVAQIQNFDSGIYDEFINFFISTFTFKNFENSDKVLFNAETNALIQFEETVLCNTIKHGDI